MNPQNPNKTVIFFIILLCFCLIQISVPLRADESEKTVLAIGIALVQEDNVAGAKQNALENALRNAL